MKDLLFANFDERSDISDATTRSSGTDVAEYDPNMLEEKFKVDRKKLELMLQGKNGGQESAEHFFDRIMLETKTAITWPSKLKIGAKSKKDPHVKITGSALGIRYAKSEIKALLDTKTSRVTLKVDISFTDHSHIIGRGGNNIQRVMTETDCHIHFPDSNRNNATEKSNQVSIAGQPEGVDRARIRIRELLPLVFVFVTPVTGMPQPLPDKLSPYILGLQLAYDIQIHFKQHAKTMGTSVIVRGSESYAPKVIEGTKYLIDHLTGNAGVFVPLKMTIEVSPQHHAKVKESCEAERIAQRTGTSIRFPDCNILTSPMSRSTVEITGTLEGVYAARRLLMECLPLVLLFDVSDEDDKFDQSRLQAIMDYFNVTINVKSKPRLTSTGVIIKGTEKDASKLFQARNALLFIKTPSGSLPPTTRLPILPSSSSLDSICYQSDKNGSVGSVNQDSSTCNGNTSAHQNMFRNVDNPPRSTGGWNTNPATAGNYPLSFMPLMPVGNGEGSTTMTTRFGRFPSGSDHSAYSYPSSTTSSLSSPSVSPRQGSPLQCSVGNCVAGGASVSPVEMPPRREHGISPFARTDSNIRPFTNTDTMNMLATLAKLSSPGATKLSPVAEAATPVSFNLQSPKILFDPQNKPPGFEQVQPMNTQFDFPEDYDHKKIKSLEAKRLQLEKPEVRVPTNSWSGYGFSQSMPENVLREKLLQCQLNENRLDDTRTSDMWKDSSKAKEMDLGSSNYMEARSMYTSSQSYVSKCCTLDDLFNFLNLSKYVDVFLQQEIDLLMFATLTDKDLKDLGISTFGARRKMLSAIVEINRQPNVFFVAPGAERKLSSSLNRSGSGNEINDSSPW